MSEPSIARGMSPKRHTLDDDSASRLLQGAIHPDDAPPGYGAVAGVLNSAARLPLRPVDEDIAANTISAMVEVIRDATPAPEIRRKTMLGKLLAGKALAAIAVVGLTATGAAAATGSLPDAAQSVVSDAVGKVGVNIPHPNHGKSAAHRQDGKHKPSDEPGHDQGDSGETGPAATNNGQQTSDDAHTAKTDAKANGEKVGPAVCAAVTEGKCQAGKGAPSGSDDESVPPAQPGEDRGKSGEEHGKSDDEHGTTPTTGSIATGEEHSERDLPSGKGKPE